MKKSMVLISAIVFSMVCGTAHGSLITGVNLMGNPGFEDATTAPWTLEGGSVTLGISTTAKTGLQSGQVDFPAAGGNIGGIRQDFAIDAGDRLQEYTLSGSVNMEGHVGDLHLFLGLWEFGSSVVFNQTATFIPSGSTGWMDLSYTTTLSSADAGALRAIFWVDNNAAAAGHFLVDDFSVVKSAPVPPPSGDNLLVNPGFEDATIAPWAPEGPTTLSISTVAKTGLQSAQVDFPGQDKVGIRQALAIDAGDRLQEYTVSCSVNTDGHTESIGFVLGLWEFGSSVVFNQTPFTWINPGTTGWVDLSFTVTLSSPDAGGIRALLWIAPQGNPKAAGHFLVDDFSLVKSSTIYGDGMPDEVERQIINHSPSDAFETLADVLPEDDYDGDGVSNLLEARAGTDATSAVDYFQITSIGESGNMPPFSISVEGKAGRTYYMEWSAALGDSWMPVDQIGPLATDQLVELSDPAPTNAEAFYRVRLTQ